MQIESEILERTPLACPRCKEPVPAPSRFCGACGAAVFLEAPEGDPHAEDDGPHAAPPARYEVLRLLGRGGMGRVYHCRDTELGVEVAVKILVPEVARNEDAVRRIKREARTSALLRECPGVLSLYGFERFGDSWFLVMEYAPGGSLLDRMRREGRIAERDVRRIGAEVAEALAFAHARAVLHRDVKPANILFTAAGRSKLGDFGLARVLDKGPLEGKAITIAGTPAYMAPELLLRAKVDERADLFSLGCTLYEAATTQRPFGPDAAKRALAEGGPPDPRKARPDLSPGFSGILQRLLSNDPGDRYPEAAAVAKALRGGQGTDL